MNSALNILLTWATNNGLDINPTKTELVLFSKKNKIPNFTLPRLKQTNIPLSNKAKYLGTILDRKLTWKDNIDERIKKSCNAFYSCKQAIGKRWGFKPNIIHWMYVSVVRPILTNSCFVWRTTLERECRKKELSKVQRTAMKAITKCFKSTPTSAL